MKPRYLLGQGPAFAFGQLSQFEALEQENAWQMLMNLNWFMFKLLGAWKGKSKYFGAVLECKDFLVYSSEFLESKEGCQPDENLACQ